MMLVKLIVLALNALMLVQSLQGHVISDEEFHNVRKLTGQHLGRALLEDIGLGKCTPEAEKDPEFWRNLARKELEQNLKKQKLNMNKAKNVIFFLGDGMSLSTVAASRMLKGQRKGNTGEEEVLSFEKFPFTGLSKTYCANAQVPDSACTATAYLCGVKANIVTIGVNANVEFNNCTASMDPKNHVSSIAAWAQKSGKSTGFITTTTLTHASPSGLYAHVANRLYESDTDVKSFNKDPNECMDMATQLITQEPGRNFNVIMGGGISKFLPNTIRDNHGNLGIREDGKNLLSTWQEMHPEGIITTNRQQLLELDVNNVSHIMGVYQSQLMDYHLMADPLEQPTLSEMTKVALEFLQRNDQGYFIFIEGGLIDIAHHYTKAAISLDETLEFEKAIQLAREMTDPLDTLIVVSSDHAHPLTISGYPGRGTDILGLNQHDTDAYGLKYSTLNYPIGIQQYLDENGHRLDLENIKRDADFEYPSYIKSNDGQHSGDDVGIFASGPFEHLFSGVLQQNTIPHLMAYAACIGDGPTMCDEK
ncbi:membrane-bound alkaline phosphatase-like [Lucilia sericata]|uniref:membrane-bound alkaline phosphatase-like n=1 Tax=Lucilia sericata TaxID=13632 RepID=UPI0018A83B17|nr:membrane-bound alkaline phosphatase-like [Lucilia sericata]